MSYVTKFTNKSQHPVGKKLQTLSLPSAQPFQEETLQWHWFAKIHAEQLR